jgi:hypothetical protein
MGVVLPWCLGLFRVACGSGYQVAECLAPGFRISSIGLGGKRVGNLSPVESGVELVGLETPVVRIFRAARLPRVANSNLRLSPPWRDLRAAIWRLFAGPAIMSRWP